MAENGLKEAIPEIVEGEASEDESVEGQSEPDFFETLSEKWDTDFFLYSGELEREGAEAFLDLAEQARHRTNVSLILTTPGGDPDAAYIIARYLQRVYRDGVFKLYIFGECKSAGTLVALGADQIIMSHRGEFGPLDVQLVKTDNILFRSSGLDVTEALNALGDHAFNIFEKQFIQILAKSSGAVSTKTAGEIATSIAVGLLAPISQQIDPLKIGETQRAIRIALQYGVRLQADPKAVSRLILGYSSHTFVIDFDEADEIFGNVTLPDALELQLEHYLQHAVINEFEADYVRTAFEGVITAYLGAPAEMDDSDEGEEKDDESETPEQVRN